MRVSHIAVLMFFAFFGLYLYTAGPSVVPFRDAGEMATTTTTLGILHPPGYPLYALVGHLASRLPLGNPAYRLNVLSALCMAACWAVFALLIFQLTDSLATAWAIAALGALSYHFWSHAVVSEMYALNALLVICVLFGAAKRRWMLTALLCGLACSNRLDFVLCLPAIFILWYPQRKNVYVGWRLTGMAILFIFGIILYLYLPARALQHPLLNWNNPSSLDQFISSLMRRGYGSGLDMLSQSYASGVNFWPEMALYGKHLFWDYGGILLPLVVIGMIILWKRPQSWFWSLVVGFGITGPLFIYLGNLPVNPHAVAIMESAYLIPDLFLLIAAAIGLAGVLSRLGTMSQRMLAVLIAIFLIVNGYEIFPAANRRDNYLAIDFARNVYAAMPPGSLVVARSDVPVFSLFYAHYVHPSPIDRYPLAQGLAASPWYKEMLGRELHGNFVLNGSLKDADGWNELRSARTNAVWQIFMTQDTEWPNPMPATDAWGLLVHLMGSGLLHPVPALPPEFLTELSVYRGRYRYDAYRDFFSSELVEEYSKAWMSRGGSDDAYWHALSLKPDMPYAAERLAYNAFSQGRFKDAERYYGWSITLFGQMLDQAVAWNALAATRKSVEEDYAGALAQAGVTDERLGDMAQAESRYREALEQDPVCADALYNLAVIYWKKADWPAVVDNLQTLARAHPEDARWKTYLPIALQHVKQKV